jgi:UDP:flavonoid glycosyltransferase YjiC (YdhE family)
VYVYLYATAKGNERVDYIPGISSTRLVDLPFIDGNKQQMLQRIQKSIQWVAKAQYLLFTSTYELESQAIDVLKAEFPFPVYAIGPTIPFFDLAENISLASHDDSDLNYLEWLDCQPRSSVLYISMGSFLSVSSAQMDELAAGLRDSGARFLWVARGETRRLKEVCGEMGLVVSWCDQLRVLSHSSIGGFLTHCGWNSTKEGVFCGVPFLTIPIVMDQLQNSRLIVEDWKIGWRVKEDVGAGSLVTREKIRGLVQNFMDLESDEVKEMRKRASEVQQISQRAIAEKGSSETNINAFVRAFSQCQAC